MITVTGYLGQRFVHPVPDSVAMQIQFRGGVQMALPVREERRQGAAEYAGGRGVLGEGSQRVGNPRPGGFDVGGEQ